MDTIKTIIYITFTAPAVIETAIHAEAATHELMVIMVTETLVKPEYICKMNSLRTGTKNTIKNSIDRNKNNVKNQNTINNINILHQ